MNGLNLMKGRRLGPKETFAESSSNSWLIHGLTQQKQHAFFPQDFGYLLC